MLPLTMIAFWIFILLVQLIFVCCLQFGPMVDGLIDVMLINFVGQKIISIELGVFFLAYWWLGLLIIIL